MQSQGHQRKLDSIFDSKASLSESKTFGLLTDINRNKSNEWLCYGGPWEPNIVAFVEMFINNHAKIPGVLGPIYTSQPIHVGRIKNSPTIGRVDLLLYENGAVVVQTKSVNDRNVYLWLDRKTALLFNYPVPTDPDNNLPS